MHRGFRGSVLADLSWIIMAWPAPISAPAQTTQGLISGRSVDARDGRAIVSALVTLSGAVAPISARSGAGGCFILPLLSPGVYRLRVEAPRYRPVEVLNIALSVAGRLDYDIRLRPLADVWESGQYRSVFLPDTEALLTFYGPDVDTSRAASFSAPRPHRGALEASISQLVEPEQVRDLPLNGRDIYTTLILQPGVAAGTANARGLGLAVNGQRPTSSNFLLDGVESNNYLVTGPLTAPAPEAIQEYRISTNNFSAEYGRTAGVLANAVTRAGGNAWHGIGYFYAKNTAWNANDFQRNLAGIPRSPLHESQPGFQAGGPILRNRLFGSASLEHLRSRGYGDPVTIQLPTSGFYSYLDSLSPVYTPGTTNTRQLLAEHPAPAPQARALAAPFELALPDHLDRWVALARFDYSAPGRRPRIAARVSESRMKRPDFIWSPYRGFDAPLVQNTPALAVALTMSLSPLLTNELRAGISSDDLKWNRPHPEIPTLAANDGTLLPGSLAFYAYDNRSRTADFSDGLLWARGQHLLQFGGGLLLRGIEGYLTAGRDGRFTFDTVADFASGESSTFSVVLDRRSLPAYRIPDYDRRYRYTQFQSYAQDTFRAAARLVLNYGLRYENFGSPANVGPAKDPLFRPGAGPSISARLASAALTIPNGAERIYTRDNRGWAARVGGSYALNSNGSRLLRAAYGIFYDRPFDNLWANVRLNGSILTDFDTRGGANFLAPGLAQAPEFLRRPVSGGFPEITWVDAGLRNAYVQGFFVGVKEQVSDLLSLEINGAGTLGRRLLTTDILNRSSRDNHELPAIRYRANQGSSNYGALQALVRYRSSLVQLQGAYTWSHSIDNQSAPLAGDFFDLAFVRLTSGRGYEAPAAFTIQGDSRGDRGNSDFDQRHNLVLAGTAGLPRPHGSPLWRWMARDWRVSMLASLRTGFPYTAYSSFPSIGEYVNRRAELVAPNAIYRRSDAEGGVVLLNRSAFADPVSGQGGLGRNSLAGPGLFNLDLSLSRSIPMKWVGEAGRLNFRADAFNFLNHANLGNPVAVLGAGGTGGFGFAPFGRKAAATGFPGLLPLNETARQIQMMVRLEW